MPCKNRAANGSSKSIAIDGSINAERKQHAAKTSVRHYAFRNNGQLLLASNTYEQLIP